jgi:hypothetical protein
MPQAVSGKYAVFRIGGVPVWGNYSWDVDPTREPVDSSNAEDGEAEIDVAGMVRAMWNVRLLFPANGTNPFDAPLNLNFLVSPYITDARLYIFTAAGPHWYFPSSIILGTPDRSEIKGRNEIELRCKARGFYVFPTGNLSVTPA